MNAGRIQRTDKYKYLGRTMSTERHSTEHIKELNGRYGIINRETKVIGAQTQVGQEEVKAE